MEKSELKANYLHQTVEHYIWNNVQIAWHKWHNQKQDGKEN